MKAQYHTVRAGSFTSYEINGIYKMKIIFSVFFCLAEKWLQNSHLKKRGEEKEST